MPKCGNNQDVLQQGNEQKTYGTSRDGTLSSTGRKLVYQVIEGHRANKCMSLSEEANLKRLRAARDSHSMTFWKRNYGMQRSVVARREGVGGKNRQTREDF